MKYNNLINKSLKGIVSLFLCGISITAFTKDIHVSALAIINGDGSEAAPYNTIQAAASVALPGDEIVIHAGTYHETVTPSKSGTANARIVYRPYQEDMVIIDATDQVSNWEVYHDTMYSAKYTLTLGAENQIFIDDKVSTS